MFLAKWFLIFLLGLKAVASISFSYKLKKKSLFALTNISFFISLLIVGHLLNIYLWDSHRLLGSTLAPPGSYLSRGLVFSSSAYLRRLLEPSLLLLLLSDIFYLRLVGCPHKKLYAVAVLFSVIALVLEAYLLYTPISLGGESAHLNLLNGSKLILLATSLLLSSFALITSEVNRGAKNLISQLIFVFSTALYFSSLLMGILPFFRADQNLPNLIAAHYYVWFPENWKANYGEANPDLRQKPELGEYNSDDPKLINSHLKKMEELNVNVLFLDWWPEEPSLKKRANFFANQIKPIHKIRYALHFETLSLAKDKKVLELNKKNVNRLKSFFERLALDHFSHPNYLTINGKKVVNIYTTRHVIGDFRNAINEIRNSVKQKTGYEMFLIGDEAYYHVISGRDKNNKLLLPEFQPDWERISALDAITLYNPYDPAYDYGDNQAEIQTNFLLRTKQLYEAYKSIAEANGVYFIPTIIPAYNDQAIRPHEKHQIIARSVGSTSTFKELELISKDILSTNQFKFLSITSWNEWNEGTNIER